jgi:hypothetical protein
LETTRAARGKWSEKIFAKEKSWIVFF